jgi:hypothetical protein
MRNLKMRIKLMLWLIVALLASLLVGPNAHAKPNTVKIHPTWARFYFHARGARINLLATATFDTKKPIGDQPSYAPGSQVSSPMWTGAMRGTITTLKVDFWQQAPLGQILFHRAEYDVVLHVGNKDHALGGFSADVPPDAAPTRVTFLYTSLDYDSQLPLKISSSPVTLEIVGLDTDPTNEYTLPPCWECATLIAYDSVQFPSGFEINAPL